MASTTRPLGVVIPPLAQVHQLGRGPGPVSFWSGRMACGKALSAALGRLLCKSRLRFFPLYTATVVRRVASPAATMLRLLPRGRASTGEAGAPHTTQRGAYPQLRCVCPKRWQRLHCSGPFGATYDSSTLANRRVR